MIIAIDYDKTYSADPEMWLYLRDCMNLRGHQTIIVTRRHPADPIPDDIKGPVIYCDNRLKRDVCEELMYQVDIWIDDEPGTIERCRVLDWSEE